MNLSVIGTGYVGLVTGACLAREGHQVVCMDIDESKVEKLKKGISPIYEPGIEDLLTKCIADKKISFTTDLSETVAHADALFLALPTPPGEDGSADLSYVMGAAKNIAQILLKYTVIINKSTVPVGSADRVDEVMSQYVSTDLFDVVSNPEFLREGKAIDDFAHPDRVVIGSQSKKARDIMDQIYAPMKDRTTILHMDRHSSEMTKYVANTFLAMKISFMNEMSRLCEDLGADVECVKAGIASDHRIGPEFINPGIGYGGSCFPKDVLALEKMAQQCGESLGILHMIIEGNKAQRQFFVEKIKNAYNGDIAGKTFALWGLAFKPDTDDIREAPALDIIKLLVQAGAKVQAYDPEAIENVQRYFQDSQDISTNIKYCDDKYEALEGADSLIIVTEWGEFLSADLASVADLLADDLIIDGRNCLDADKVTSLGMKYISIGRSDKSPD